MANAAILLKIKFEKTSQHLKALLCSYNKESKLTATINNCKNESDHDNNDHFEQEEGEQCEKGSTHDTCQANFEDGLVNKHKLHSDSQILEAKQNPTNNLNLKKSAKTNMVYSKISQTHYHHICPFCKINLPNATEIKKHAQQHKTLKRYLIGRKIPQRARFFARPRNSRNIFARQEILHKCVYCNKELAIDNFLSHILQHNRQDEYSCKKCNRVFRKKNHLNSHITYTHLEEFPYQCGQCNKGFVIKENYEAHVLLHSNPEILPYNCDKCEKSFTNKKHLYYHSFKHTELGSFSAKYKTHRCKICLRTFDSADSLQEHRIELHNRARKKIEIKMNAEGLFECIICLKTYVQAAALKQHLRKTHGPKNLCSLCGASVLNLKQHLISHETKRDPLECHICHKLLASKLTLSRHIRVHTGEKPYKCSYCDKTFKDHYPMRVHERIHKGEKKHICSVCGKGFLEKSYMMKHLRAVHVK